ncbi:protein kinase [Novymonas esmeraldas]|uniref:Protein kinase n=1 Tax=Novymonas esmeraldas TaxID=1808958 RepID=A0AAW0EQK7_9TRYP
MYGFSASADEEDKPGSRLRCPQRRSHSISSDDSVTPSEEERQSGVMQYIDAAAAAAAATSDDAVCPCPPEAGRLSRSAVAAAQRACCEVGDRHLTDGEDDAGTTASRTGGLSRDRTVTDVQLLSTTITSPTTTTTTVGACASPRRGKDEVDVAAEGIPLEVRRFQCTKSILALKEATKNDSTPVPAKLVDYIVSLTTPKGGLCTQREMCDWLVAQVCDRIETGQVWVIAKTSSLLFTLLWRGSRTFVESVRERGASLFQVSHLAEVMRRTPQENITGERLPCSLQPIKHAVAGQKSAGNRARPTTAAAAGKPPAMCFLERLKHMKSSPDGASSWCSKASEPAPVHIDPTVDIPEGEFSFLISNTAYMEALCEYRFRHPTLDLEHGEIVCDTDDRSPHNSVGSNAASATGGAPARRISPAAWKELLDDTLELMKAIATTNPQVSVCCIGVNTATMRLRNAVLLYQVACRALVRFVYSILTSLHTLVVSLQTGLGVPSTMSQTASAGQAAGSVAGSGSSRFGDTAAAVDFTLTPATARGFVQMHYNAVYQFNRTVRMLKASCESSDHVCPDMARKVGAALKLFPEDDLATFRDTIKSFQKCGCNRSMDQLHLVAQQSSSVLSGSTVLGSSMNSTSTAESTLFSSAPLHAEEVREALVALYEFHDAHKEEKQRMWSRQVAALCTLFDEKESAMLRQIFQAGLDGLWGQWRDFTNNGRAAAEKALTASVDSTLALAKREGSSMQGMSSSESGAGAAAAGAGGRHSSVGDATTRSATYILRSLPGSGQQQARPGSGKTDVISLNSGTLGSTSNGLSSTERSTERSIEALLQEDDVVVICNEECSCNDTLKLIDRFQVLMDIPLGQGSYGKVFRAWDEVIGCYLAAKELPLDSTKAHNVAVREVLQEYTVLTELSHPNIVRVVAFMVLKETARIYMEWMPSGSLQDVLRHHPRGTLRESVVRRYARDVLSGLAYLHSRGVIHRDVKPGNMLLSSDGTVKLTDFGTSLVLSGNSHTLESNAITGTAAYMAPECVQGTYSSASDIWSFGCSVVQLLSGNVPWFNAQTGSLPEPIALLFKIGCLDDATHLERPHDALVAAAVAAHAAEEVSASLDATLSNPSTASISMSAVSGTSKTSKATSSGAAAAAAVAPPPEVSDELIDMLNAIFVADRKKRPTASDLMHHPFFKVM